MRFHGVEVIRPCTGGNHIVISVWGGMELAISDILVAMSIQALPLVFLVLFGHCHHSLLHTHTHLTLSPLHTHTHTSHALIHSLTTQLNPKIEAYPRVFLPMGPAIRSYNLSNAASVGIMEAVRQVPALFNPLNPDVQE